MKADIFQRLKQSNDNRSTQVMKSEIFYKGFPKIEKDVIQGVVKKLPLDIHNTVHEVSNSMVDYTLNGVVLSFPTRIYLHDVESDVLSKLNREERMILHCIYSRHCSGYVREKHIRCILAEEFPIWVIPYLVKISDEYVVEILEIIYEVLKDRNTDFFKQFCDENNVSFYKSYDRMISYWNEYYRRSCHEFKNYVGRKLFVECFGA